MACITKAIFKDPKTEIVLINPDRCINCGMCAMACPFGVIRYHIYPANRWAAHKCDQCILRLGEGDIPACVQVCKVGALVFDEVNRFMDQEASRMATLIYWGIREKPVAEDVYFTLKAYKSSLEEIRTRR